MARINIDEIYQELIRSGFYENIYLDICGDIKPDDTIVIPERCNNRLEGIERLEPLGDFEIYISPCRVGRTSKYCPKQVIKKEIEGPEGKIECVLENTEISCPLCLVIDSSKVTPCKPLTHLLSAKIELSANFILIPNAYPYLEKQFLITTPIHSSQIETLNDPNNVQQLYDIFIRILNLNEDMVFFNGICGNSLLHFHCQYTTSSVPIFRILDPTYHGYYEHNLFRGYVVIASDYNQVVDVINNINSLNFTYNFICRKVNENTLQFVFYIRFCDYEHFKDLNLGSTELSGVIYSNTPPTYDLNDINDYLELTNNKNNYNYFINRDKGGKRKYKTRKNKRRKNKTRSLKKKQYKKNKYSRQK